MEDFEKLERYWKRQRILARATGALEVLSGAGMMAGAYLAHKELGDVTSIVLASAGALVIADGIADVVSGRMAYLLENISGKINHHYQLKEKAKNEAISLEMIDVNNSNGERYQ